MLTTLSYWIFFAGLTEAQINFQVEQCYKLDQLQDYRIEPCRELAYYLSQDRETVEKELEQHGHLFVIVN